MHQVITTLYVNETPSISNFLPTYTELLLFFAVLKVRTDISNLNFISGLWIALPRVEWMMIELVQ